MGAEMNKGIGLKLFLHIEIRRYIGVGRHYFHSVNQLKVIIPQGRSRLGEDQNVAISQPCHSQTVAT